MKNYIYIGERSSYKTQLALHKFMEDPSNSLLVVPFPRTARAIFSSILARYKLNTQDEIYLRHNIIDISHHKEIQGPISRVIFDEFFSMENRLIERFWHNVTSIIPPVPHNNGISIYSSLSEREGERLGQERFVANLISQGWVRRDLRTALPIDQNMIAKPPIYPFDNSIL